ncbi:hypothetical protein [Halorubellus litoreus]|uniref:Uncharacterized protein n=1 Tax=Halorubellus litoreus TaxID=755308 RepID=A0ABD5VFB4_9EURY
MDAPGVAGDVDGRFAGVAGDGDVVEGVRDVVGRGVRFEVPGLDVVLVVAPPTAKAFAAVGSTSWRVTSTGLFESSYVPESVGTLVVPRVAAVAVAALTWMIRRRVGDCFDVTFVSVAGRGLKPVADLYGRCLFFGAVRSRLVVSVGCVFGLRSARSTPLLY